MRLRRKATRRPWLRTIGRVIGVSGVAVFACLSYSWITLPDTRPLARTNPTSTAFMRLRQREAEKAGKTWSPRHRWLAYGRISPTLRQAVIMTEDAAFWSHHGVDMAELRASLRTYWERGGELRGGSTITQQLAKNLYLSPSRNPYRKVVELMIARRLEATLPKTRILELYLNLIEWGDAIWGADAAVRAYFGQSASDVSPEQAALLAGAIINARIYNPARPNGRLLRRQQIVLRRLTRGVTVPGETLETDGEDEAEEPPAIPAPFPSAPDPAIGAPPAPTPMPPDPLPPPSQLPPAPPDESSPVPTPASP